MYLWSIDDTAALASTITALSVVSISLALRLIARYRQKSSFGVDDHLAILAWVVFVGICGATIYWNLPDDSSDDPNSDDYDRIYGSMYKAEFAALLCNIVAIGTGRLSAVFFYRRIFCARKQDVFNILTKIMVGVLLLWTVGFFLSSLLSCGADITTTMWPWRTSASVCIVNGNQIGYAVSSFLLDLLVLILPLPKIWGLKTTIGRKIAISVVFLIGLISLAASGVRAVYTSMLQDDADYISYDTYFLQFLETFMCLLAINMPSIWYFLRHLKPEKLRQIVLNIKSYRFTNSQESTEPSHNEGMEFSDNTAILARRSHLGLEASHHLSQEESAEKSDYQLQVTHCPEHV